MSDSVVESKLSADSVDALQTTAGRNSEKCPPIGGDSHRGPGRRFEGASEQVGGAKVQQLRSALRHGFLASFGVQCVSHPQIGSGVRFIAAAPNPKLPIDS